ncbi:MAG: DUF2007 domain-containing protein [Pirellulales bacterium]
MAVHPERIARLTSAPLEMEAGIIVAALEQNGIKSTMAGQTTAGFRAEAPGWVQVLVAEEDLPRAQAILDDVRQHHDDIDWAAVDVGEPEDMSAADSTPRLIRLTVWLVIAFALLTLLII